MTMESSIENSSEFPAELIVSFEGDAQKGNFYSVYIPPDVRQKGTQICQYVFTDKVEAMKMVKKTKKARFKHFERYQEAIRFADVGIVDQPKSPISLNGSIVQNNSVNQLPIGNERVSPFKGPKPQDLVKLRKSIETGDYSYFSRAVWENPRYLVSNGDTPSILQVNFCNTCFII